MRRAEKFVALLTLAFVLSLGRPALAQQSYSTTAAIVRDAMAKYHLKSIVVQVRSGGNVAYTSALGESMTGVPATPAMHFRNGAMAFTYMSTLLMELVDQHKARLDDKVAAYLPSLPNADKITLKNLANMTSGYADYVYTPEVLRGTSLDPFRQWTSDELIQIGVSKPMMFEPGTNWGYSHTNYVILARIIEKITGMPMDKAMQTYVLSPLNLTQTRGSATPEIPEPAMHTFSSERRSDLGIAAGVPFYEESTYWNPSWTTAEGAVETTDIADMNASMEAIATGKLLSKESLAAQVAPNLIGFGHVDPACPVCRPNNAAFNYGLGVVIIGPWITQTKFFAGADATVGYLGAQKLSIAVATTLAASAFDDKGNAQAPSIKIFSSIANALAPGTLPLPDTR